jgi:3-phenylpropionate/trans-cinnamate dioxygenase ferredoxin reductase subunit
MEFKTEYLIIGSGVAGVTAAAQIRRQEPKARIAIIGREPVPFYSRVMLTNYLSGEVGREKLFLRDEDWFSRQGISLYLAEEALSVDTSAGKLKTKSGKIFNYAKLLLATGVSPKKMDIPGGDAEGVHYFWDLADAEKIKDAISNITASSKEKSDIVVIGGGFICQAYRKIFSRSDFNVHLLMRGEYYWTNYVSREIGGLINDKFTKGGLILHKNTRVKEIIKKDDRTLEVVADNGQRIRAAMVLVGIGTEPNTAWLKESGVELDDGIKTDEYLQTSVANVFAAGDAVNYFDVYLGEHYRRGNWANAQRQGETAGKNMVNKKNIFQAISVATLSVDDLSLGFIGGYERKMVDRAITRCGPEKGQVRDFLFKENRLVGAVLANALAERPLIEQAIRDKIKLTEEEQKQISDQNFPLEKSKIYGA